MHLEGEKQGGDKLAANQAKRGAAIVARDEQHRRYNVGKSPSEQKATPAAKRKAFFIGLPIEHKQDR